MIMKIILKTVVLKIKKIRLFVKIAIVVILKKLLSFIQIFVLKLNQWKVFIQKKVVSTKIFNNLIFNLKFIKMMIARIKKVFLQNMNV